MKMRKLIRTGKIKIKKSLYDLDINDDYVYKSLFVDNVVSKDLLYTNDDFVQ